MGIFVGMAGETAVALKLRDRLEPQVLLFLRKIRSLRIEENGLCRHVRAEYRESLCAASAPKTLGALGGSISRCVLYDHVQYMAANATDAGEGSSNQESSSTADESSTEFIVYHRLKIVPPRSFGDNARGEIAIAVPVKQELTPQSFFTFLPVCSAGFPFAIHCNMELTASRQQIHQDSAWNLWLRDQLAGTFSMNGWR